MITPAQRAAADQEMARFDAAVDRLAEHAGRLLVGLDRSSVFVALSLTMLRSLADEGADVREASALATAAILALVDERAARTEAR